MVNPILVIDKFSVFHQYLEEGKQLGSGPALWQGFGWSCCSWPANKGGTPACAAFHPRLLNPCAFTFMAKCGGEPRDAGSGWC